MIDIVTRVNIAETILKYSWRDRKLIATALRHRSWCNENRRPVMRESNERLEFLGDSVLYLMIADTLYHRHPQQQEGFLSEERSKVVSTGKLAASCRMFKLQELLLIGRGAKDILSLDRTCANLMEAIIGAAFTDGGMQAASNICKRVGIL